MHTRSPTKQTGVALVVAMIMLVVITTLSLSSMRVSLTDSKIAANHQHKQATFEAAESALAKIFDANPGKVTPDTIPGAYRDFPDYYEDEKCSNAAEKTCSQSAVRVTYQETRDDLVLAGFETDTIGIIYYADAQARYVSKAKGDLVPARTAHRLGLVLPRPAEWGR